MTKETPTFHVSPATRPDGVIVYRLVTEPQGSCTDAGIAIHYETEAKAREAARAQGWSETAR
jgi:hypothetical protein